MIEETKKNKKIMVCGSRIKKDYSQLVKNILSAYLKDKIVIIEGCCPNSADKYAEDWAREHDMDLYHYPGSPGNYLYRNIEMVDACDEVIAFWDGFSYGTAHAIATAVNQNKPVMVIELAIIRKRVKQ